MSHPFGDLVTQHLHRKPGLGQHELATGTDQDPALIDGMCRGRRLSDPQARARVVAIVDWLHAQGVLDTRAEANVLLQAADMSRLDPHDAVESELLAALSESAPDGADAADKAPSGPPLRASRRSRRNSPLPMLALNALVIIAIVGLFLLRQRATRVVLWEETFDPLHASRWQDTPASAVWEDLPGPGAALRENHPQQDTGQVKSVPISLDAGDYPVLLISVRAVEPGAGYTIQVWDETSGASVDVLKEVTRPGEHAIDLVQAIGRQGSSSCTIDVWVNGESRAVTFERIAIVAGRTGARGQPR